MTLLTGRCILCNWLSESVFGFKYLVLTFFSAIEHNLNMLAFLILQLELLCYPTS